MAGTYRGATIPLAEYHGVPSGWRASEIIAQHAQLQPSHALVVPDVIEPGAPAWLPERRDWLQYRAALQEVARGVALADEACIELAIRFIELRHIGSYSGFIRERLAGRLANAPMASSQRHRLQRHFETLVLAQEKTQEFRAYLKVWRRIITPEDRAEVLAKVRKAHGAPSAEWLAEKLDTYSRERLPQKLK